MNSEEFTNDFINSIRDDKASNFQRRYRDVDVLLIDDIQFLAGQGADAGGVLPHLQHAAQRQQAGRHHRPTCRPSSCPGSRSGCAAGSSGACITDVQPPDLETRIAILRKKAIQERMSAPDDVLEYIASRISTNIRELEGALIRVTAFASLNRQPVDTGPGRDRAASDLIPSEQPAQITSRDDHGADRGVLRPDHRRPVQQLAVAACWSTARQIAMYLCRELTDLSLPKIGQQFGGRDHTTVMHADQQDPPADGRAPRDLQPGHRADQPDQAAVPLSRPQSRMFSTGLCTAV